MTIFYADCLEERFLSIASRLQNDSSIEQKPQQKGQDIVSNLAAG